MPFDGNEFFGPNATNQITSPPATPSNPASLPANPVNEIPQNNPPASQNKRPPQKNDMQFSYLVLCDGTITGNNQGYKNLAQNGDFSFQRMGDTRQLPGPVQGYREITGNKRQFYVADKWSLITGRNSWFGDIFLSTDVPGDDGPDTVGKDDGNQDPLDENNLKPETASGQLQPGREQGIAAQGQTGPGRHATRSAEIIGAVIRRENPDRWAVFRNYIEGYDIVQLCGRPVVLSFWIKITRSGFYGINLMSDAPNPSQGPRYNNLFFEIKKGKLRNGEEAQPYSAFLNNPENFDLTDKENPPEWDIDLEKAPWVKKTVRFTMPDIGTVNTTNGVGLAIGFTLAAGGNELGQAGTPGPRGHGPFSVEGATPLQEFDIGINARITMIQLEDGTINTSFEKRPGTVELPRLQRYYQIWTPRTHGILGSGHLISSAAQTDKTKADTAYIAATYSVPMRASPRVIFKQNAGRFVVFNGSTEPEAGPTEANIALYKQEHFFINNPNTNNPHFNDTFVSRQTTAESALFQFTARSPTFTDAPHPPNLMHGGGKPGEGCEAGIFSQSQRTELLGNQNGLYDESIIKDEITMPSSVGSPLRQVLVAGCAEYVYTRADPNPTKGTSEIIVEPNPPPAAAPDFPAIILDANFYRTEFDTAQPVMTDDPNAELYF